MKILNQDLWSSKADLIVVTCNGYVTKDGRLVMGRGAAKEASDKFPALQKQAGDLVPNRSSMKMGDNIFVYGFFAVPLPPRKLMGFLQVKYHFRDKASLSLIGYSIVKMNDRLRSLPEIRTVAMNFPGIGYGGLKREEVEPLLRDLDGRVTIYTKE